MPDAAAESLGEGARSPGDARPIQLRANDATHAGWTLAAGETLLWEGRPAPLALAIGAFHLPIVAAYFGALAAWGLAESGLGDATIGAFAMPLATGLLTLAVLAGTAFLLARTTRYLVTNDRVILRYGAALPRSLSIPLRQIVVLEVSVRPSGRGDIALTLRSGNHVPYLKLWPHVRPWRVRRPEPMLRGVADAALIAPKLARILSEFTQRPGQAEEVDRTKP